MQHLKMPVKYWVIILSLLISFVSNGQKYSVGIKASPLVTWPSFGDKNDKQNFSRSLTIGFSAGALLSFPLKNNFDFFIEGSYSQKGRALKFNNDEWTNRSTYRFLDGTLLLRKSYKFRLEKNVPSLFFFNIGPEVSYWINGNGQIIVSDIPYPYTIAFDQTRDSDFTTMYLNDVNRWLFGLVIGVGINAPVLRGQHITTELRFTSGHTFLGKKNSSYIEILTFQDTMMTNLKALSLSISYTFDFDVQKSRKGKSTLDKKIKRRR